MSLEDVMLAMSCFVQCYDLSHANNLVKSPWVTVKKYGVMSACSIIWLWEL